MFLVLLIVFSILGAMLIILGGVIWGKQAIKLIHSTNYAHVRDEDKKAYTRSIGIGLIVLGIGLLLTGVINFATSTYFGWIAFGVLFLIGVIILCHTQFKYNKIVK